MTKQERLPTALAAVEEETRVAGFPMASDRLTGALLRTLAAAKPGGRLLELGTGTGLATCWLLDGMDAAAALLSVDNDPAVQSIARRHLGQDPRLTLATQDGGEFVQALGRQGRRFDLIFADTWPGKYYLLDEALALLAPGGLYVIDDMLSQPNWPDGHAPKVAALIDTIGWRDDLIVARLDWSTGLILATRRADR